MTHVLKTPPLRSHCNMYLNFLLNLKNKPKHICGQVLIPIQVVLLLIHILHMSKAQRIYNREFLMVLMFLHSYSEIWLLPLFFFWFKNYSLWPKLNRVEIQNKKIVTQILISNLTTTADCLSIAWAGIDINSHKSARAFNYAFGLKLLPWPFFMA